MPNFVFLDKTNKPDEKDILHSLDDASSLWLDIHRYIEEHYDFTPEMTYFTKNYGWSIRYRRKNKTLCYVFPGEGNFSILIVLGRKEVERVELVKDTLNESIKNVFEQTEQLHDGRWLWISITNGDDLASFKTVLTAKKKPNVQ